MSEPHTKSSINNLKSIIGKRGVSKSNRFEVDLSGMVTQGIADSANDVRDLESLLISTTLPGRQLTTFGYDLFRHSTEIPTGYVNEALTMEFRLTADYFAKTIFDRWINKVVPKDEYLIAYGDEYKCSIVIKQLDNKDSVIYEAELDKCFPKAIRGIAYNTETDAIGIISVEFAYNDLNFPSDPKSAPSE
jgi:YD repeat-containing protein